MCDDAHNIETQEHTSLQSHDCTLPYLNEQIFFFFEEENENEHHREQL